MTVVYCITCEETYAQSWFPTRKEALDFFNENVNDGGSPGPIVRHVVPNTRKKLAEFLNEYAQNGDSVSSPGGFDGVL